MSVIGAVVLNVVAPFLKVNFFCSEMFHENFAKRTRGWVALRGMWGKRSDPEVNKKSPIPKVTEEEAKQIVELQQ